MAGGLMQLVAYGAQDIYLTGNPKVTFFQAVYKRHTNFAMETIQQTVNGSPSNGGRLSVTVARNGDLVGEMYCVFTTLKTLAPFSNTAAGGTTELGGTADARLGNSGCWVAERAVNDVELSIGGQRIDKHYQKWWRLYSELYLTEAQRNNWGKMTSISPLGRNAATGTAQCKVTLPLIFFFNRNPGMYLPLIALQYHEVRVDLELAPNYDKYFDTTKAPEVWANYVYLDTEERRRFSQKGHEYLIEQVQHTGADSVTTSTGATAAPTPHTVRLSFNHPVKELVWCVSETTNTGDAHWNFTSNVTSGLSALVLGGVRGYSHANAIACSTSAIGVPHFLGGDNMVQVNNAIHTINGQKTLCEVSSSDEANLAANVSAGNLASFRLVLNGQDRMKEQNGRYYNQTQPFYHHSGSPYPGIYSYSFALKPEEHQPTGTCNFSRIDNAQAQFSTWASNSAAKQMNMFAVNYNVLRVQSGMGGLAFSN